MVSWGTYLLLKTSNVFGEKCAGTVKVIVTIIILVLNGFIKKSGHKSFGIVSCYYPCIFKKSETSITFLPYYREFCKKVNGELPYFYWSLNERFTTETYPSFDDVPENTDSEHPTRLHKKKTHSSEDTSVFVAGRPFLPLKNQTSVRQRLHKPILTLQST